MRTRLPITLLLLGSCAATADNSRHMNGRYELFVLGVAQDGGLPHLGCTKTCCETARRDGRRLYPTSLGVHDRQTGALLLVEATPFVEDQAAMLHRLSGKEPKPRQPVDALLLTHAHIGHYLGLAQFGREVASTKELPVWVSERMAGFLGGNGPWNQLVDLRQIRLMRIAPRTEFEPLPGLKVTAVPVPHRDEYSDTLAFKIRGPNRTVLFVPDIDRWEDELLSELLDGVDVAYLDGSFYDGREVPDRDLSEIPHPPMVVTMQVLGREARARPGRLRFIHLNHTNPVLGDAGLRAGLEAQGFRIAEQGERVEM